MRLLFALILCLGVSVTAHANMDDGLYDPLPPEGSAFVRFINVAAEKNAIQVGVNGKSYASLQKHEISPYFIVKQGSADVNFGDLKHQFEAEAGKFYTVTGADDLKFIEDEANDNRTKSQILFYNLSNHENLSLKTKDGKVGILENIAQYESNSRQINPVKIEVAIFEGDTKIKDIEPQSLERGMAYSAIIFADNDEVVWVRSTTNTTK